MKPIFKKPTAAEQKATMFKKAAAKLMGNLDTQIKMHEDGTFPKINMERQAHNAAIEAKQKEKDRKKALKRALAMGGADTTETGEI